MLHATKLFACAVFVVLTTHPFLGIPQNSPWIDQMTVGQDITGPSGVLTGPFGRPRAVLDEFGTLRLPILIFSDKQVDEFVPDITDPNSMRLGEFRNCGTYTVMLYLYDKEKEGIRKYTLTVDTSIKSATIMEGVGFTEPPKTFALPGAPARISGAAANISAILLKEISHPTATQQRNWDSMAAACPQKRLSSPDSGVPKRALQQSNKPIAGQIYKIGNDVSAPTLILAKEPDYSLEAKQKKIGGEVLVDLVVGTDGFPSNVRVSQPLGHGLDEKAIEAVQQYRFKPATKNGAPVMVNVRVRVTFQIF